MPSSSDLLTPPRQMAGRLAALLDSLPHRLAVFAVFAAAWTWPLLSTATMMNLFRDAQVLFSYEEVATWSVLRHHQIPLWDPYYCGGLYALGTPQSRFASPTFLLSVLFGASRGEALTIFALLIVGLEGTFRYARERGADVCGAVAAAPVFAASGLFMAAPFLGWTHFFGFELVPWTLYGFRRGLRGDRRGLLIAAAAVAWTVGFGGTYAGPISVALCGFELAEYGFVNRLQWRALLSGAQRSAVAGALALGLSAVRSLPLAETLYQSPRLIAGEPSFSAAELLHAVLRPVAVEGANLAQTFGMFTIGLPALAVALVGAGRRRMLPVVLLAGLSFWAAMGYAPGRWSLFAQLKELPVYSALRYPERYLIVVALAASVLAANALGDVERRAGRWRHGFVVVSLVYAALVANAGLQLWNARAVANARSLAAPPSAPPTAFHQARGNRWLAAYYPAMSRGSLSCWEAYPVPMSRLLRGDLAAEESLVDPSSGSVVTRRWSPNAIDVDVTLTRPGQLRVNQNYHPGWKSDVGAVYSDHGLIGVRLPAGSSRVGLRFRPRSAIVGGMVTILSIVAFMLLWRRGPGTRIASPIVEVVAASLPLLCGVGLYACLSEPPPERALLVAPTGEPVLASSPPAGSVAVGLDFLDAVTLAASSMPSPDRFVRGEVASLELDWIARGELPREEEVVVRIEGTEGAVWEGSHGLLSAAITLAAAPRNTVLRDIVPLVVPRSLPPGRLDVLVALRNRRTGRLVAGMKSTGPAAERRGAFSLVAQIEPSP